MISLCIILIKNFEFRIGIIFANENEANIMPFPRDLE